jgi:hypothetical protein
MDSIIHRDINGAIIVHRLVSESCTRMRIIMTTSFVWCFLHQSGRQIVSDIIRRMAHIKKIFDIRLALPRASRDVMESALWYILWCHVRFHSFRLSVFALHFQCLWYPQGPPSNIFLLHSLCVWPSMSGRSLSWWLPGIGSLKIERITIRGVHP